MAAGFYLYNMVMPPKPLYDEIGMGYNTTRQADPHITAKLFHFLAPLSSGTYLDIGCGTGNYTIAMAAKGAKFTGVEPSENMLAVAKSRCEDIEWLYGNAERIPVTDAYFDGAIATLTIHHWTNLDAAFSELYRVLKPGSRVVIFTAAPEQMRGYWLNHYFPKMMSRSVIQMPSVDNVVKTAIRSGLYLDDIERYFVEPKLKDHFLYCGKHDPKLYFNKEIRSGISSFSSLANATEVSSGLSKLYADLQNDKFTSIKKHYDNDMGDYMFITLLKR